YPANIIPYPFSAATSERHHYQRQFPDLLLQLYTLNSNQIKSYTEKSLTKMVRIEEKQGTIVPSSMPQQQNHLQQLQAKFKEVENGFRAWLSKQPLPVEATVVTTTGAAQGAAIGALMGTLTNDISSSLQTPPQASLNPQAMASFKQAQALSGGPLVQARNFAVMTGVNAGISCVMKRLRGKEDVQSSMAAAFGSGAMFSLVSGMGGPNQAANAVTSGLFFALVQGGLFQVMRYLISLIVSTSMNFEILLCRFVASYLIATDAYLNMSMADMTRQGLSQYVEKVEQARVQCKPLGKKFSQPPVEDVNYYRTRSMLNSLGLQNYEKNFKKGFALRDVKIPPGPRLLILDHIQ
ncbi:hypothetical protein Golob_016354, partial [Gossypium lobatum]|nr:hypothetical protein [Gossypium lobatum]